MAGRDVTASSSSYSFGSSTHDVFINFRDEDTRHNFTDFLCREMSSKGINAFIYSRDLWGGEEIKPALLEAIRESKISIPVFSKGYADSKWCLIELVEMVRCWETDGQKIVPIFFDVEPSEVRYQIGSFEVSFQKHEKKFDAQTIKSWKGALTAVANLGGYVLNHLKGNEVTIIDHIVDYTLSTLIRPLSCDIKYPIGLHERVEDLILLLDSTHNVQFVGICGIGGIGKTTIARALYNRIFKKFHKSCFLANIRKEASTANGIVSLQGKLLNIVSKENVYSQISDVHMVKLLIKKAKRGEMIKRTLRRGNILLILDDVDHSHQLDALAVELSSFGPNSRIVITTRDKHILKVAKVDEGNIYWPKVLDDKQSLQLFSLHAFSKDQPPEDYKELSHDFIHMIGGLPLAIEVLGASLYNTRDKGVWQSALQKLKEIHIAEVKDNLRISYDSLKDDEKSIFLDVACFFVGWRKETVISLWEACGFESISAIEKLTERSLLKVEVNLNDSYEKIWMHDQIQAMGRSIIFEESPSDPSLRSRLWSEDEILDVLTKHMGTDTIEGILPPSNLLCCNACIHREDFAMMSKLRFLYINGAQSDGAFPHLPTNLSWFSWWGCPLETIPINFYHKKLVYMNLSNSQIKQSWRNKPANERQRFQRLKVLRLRFCEHLIESPDFSWFPYLETLDLGCCKNMVNLHKSVGDLKSLVKLYLDDTKIEELPDSICRLSSLQFLTLCSCSSLQNLPESIGDLNSLVTLSLDGTKIKELPDSICRLSSLQSLTLSWCSSFRKLPESICDLDSLVTLSLDRTKIEELPDSICRLSSLQVLNLNRCSSLKKLPESIDDLKSLTKLSIRGTKIKTLPNSVGLLEKLESPYIWWTGKNV